MGSAMMACDLDGGDQMKDRLRIGAERLGFTKSEIAELLRVYVTVRARAENRAKGLMIDGRFSFEPGGPVVRPS